LQTLVSCSLGYSKVIIDSGRYCIWERVGTKSFTGFLILLLTLTLAFTFEVQLVKSESTSESGRPVARVIPEVVELGPRNVTGQTFSIAVVVENITRLGGLDIVFQYDPIYLDYVNHTMTMPVEDFPEPIPPSPYPGIIHDPRLCLLDDVYTEQGSYYVAFTTLGGPSFNGSGTVFVMTFRVKSQPTPEEDDIITGLDIIRADYPCPIECSLPTIDGTVIIHALAPTIGGPSFSIESEHLSSWLASSLLVVALFFASSIYLRRKHV